jgi:putative transposase
MLSAFASVAVGSGSDVLRTPCKGPRVTASGARSLGSLRRACLEHLFILNERPLWWMLREYVGCFNGARPHQSLRQRLSDNA